MKGRVNPPVLFLFLDKYLNFFVTVEIYFNAPNKIFTLSFTKSLDISEYGLESNYPYLLMSYIA
jgi:hypothetical protein